MADKFDIEAKLKITGVDVKGDLNAGKLKFDVDTSALKKLVSEAAKSAKQVKAKFDGIKLNKLKLEVNQNSLRTVEGQIRRAVQSAVQKTRLDIQTNVAGGTKTDPFKAQRQAAARSAKSLQTMHDLTKQVNSGLRSLVKTMGSLKPSGPAAAAKGNLPFPAGTRTVNVGSLGGGGGRIPPSARGGAGAGGFDDGDAVGKTARAVKQLTSNTKEANQEMLTLDELTFQVGRKAAAFRGVAIAINALVNALQASAKFVIEFNDSLIEVNKILQLSDRSLQILGDDLFALSASTGVATTETIAIAESFARAGLAGRGYGTVVDLAQRALVGLQGTTLDANQASELFIQIIQQVEANVRGLSKELVTTTKLFDVLGKAEDITASKATDVQQAFKRSAASIFATGATIEEATAIISVLQERTQRGGDVIGTALKTLASRISSSSSDATKALNEIGVETIDAQGNLRNLFDVLQDTAVAFQSLTESERADVAVKAAGIRQVEVFRAALLDFGRTQDVTNELINASGDAARKQAAEQSKLANVLSRLQLGFQQLIRTASEGVLGEIFVGAITAVEKLVTFIANLDRNLGGVLTTMAGFAGAALAFNVLIPMFQGIFRAMKFFAGTQQEAIANMDKLKGGTMNVATTVEGQLNASLMRTATLTNQAAVAMQGLGQAATVAAGQAQALAGVAAGNAGAGGVPIVAGGRSGGRNFQAFQSLGFGQVRGGVPKEVGLLGKAAEGTSKALKGITGNALAFGILATAANLAGGALQNLAGSLGKSGSSTLGTVADIGGGVLSGAATGAVLGSIVPGIGTGIGAGVGALAGALAPLTRALGDSGDEIDNLRQRYLELGLVQAENGEITSAVAAKLDAALRNLEAFQNLELNLADRAREDLFDPEGAGARSQAVDRAREQASQGLLASFDRNAEQVSKNTRVFQAISKALQARVGDTAIDLADPQLLEKASPALAGVGENVLREIEAEAVRLAESLGISANEISDVFDEEIQKIRNKPITRKVVEAAEQAVQERTDSFVNSLDVLLPAGEQISRAAREQSAKFKEAVQAIALGQGGEEAQKVVRETLAKVLSGQTILKGAGDDTLAGTSGRNAIQAILDQAQDIAGARRNVGVQGFGSALPEILKRIGPALGGGAEATQIARIQERLIKSQERTTEAFSSIREQFPIENFGRFLDTPINELEIILRDFIAEFGREIAKLNEAQLRATTPQVELADALAQNSLTVAQATQRRVELEKADALRTQQQAFQQLPGLGAQQFAGVPGREDETRTVGDALKELFQALLDANRRIASEGIVDPDRQRDIVSQARESVDLTNIDDKQIKAVTDSVLELSKTFVKLDTEALQAISKSNAAAVASLKRRLSEEQRLLALDQRRRAAIALNQRAAIEELTGVRRLVAERQMEADLANASISAQRGRVEGIDKELSKLRAVEQTEVNRVAVLDQIEQLERARADESIKLEEQIAKNRIAAIRNTLAVAKEAVNVAKQAGSQERKRIGLLADINSLLSVDENQLNRFNAELEALGARFKTSQAELAAEAAVVNATITNQAEKESRLADIKRRGNVLALEQAKAEAQIIQKRREAIKQVAQELLGNQQQQVDAQRAIIEATKGVADAFENYLQAVDGAIMATTRYNLGLALAEVETTRITGGFSGLRQEIGAVQDAFRDAERLARDLGASEKTLVEIRRESINQQLQLFNQLLQEQSSLARNFFQSSSQDQADLFLGIQEAGSIAEILGGSFEEFKKKGESAINNLGAQLLALPQETRQRVISSLETLSAIGGEVGGFSAQELLTAIETAALGVSGEGLEVDPLFEVQERIASLQEEQARLATEQLIASQEQVTNAKEQLEQAEAQKDLAEIQLERIKEEGDKLRGQLGTLQGELKTTLIRQDQTARAGFSAVRMAVGRSTSAINSLPDALSVKVAEAFREVFREIGPGMPGQEGRTGQVSSASPTQRGTEQIQSIRQQGNNLAEAKKRASQSGPALGLLSEAVSGRTQESQSNLGDTGDLSETNRRLQEVIDELSTLNTTGVSSNEVLEEIRDASGTSLGTAAATTGGAGASPEITINVEGTTTVTVTGFEAGVARLATALAESLGGFVSDDEARRIANEVLDNIRTELLRRGIITPTTL